MKKGYTEWISENNIGFITNPFNRVLYINANWPEGEYVPLSSPCGVSIATLKEKCKKGREFTKEELVLELL